MYNIRFNSILHCKWLWFHCIYIYDPVTMLVWLYYSSEMILISPSNGIFSFHSSVYISPAFYSIRKGRKRETIRHGGRKSGTSRKRNSGEGSCRREGAETGRPSVSAPTHFCFLTEYLSISLLREWLSSPLVVHPLLGVFFPGLVLCVQLCFTTMCMCVCVWIYVSHFLHVIWNVFF